MGQTNNISPLLWYSFYEPVYYKDETVSFPLGSKERHGYWVGISEHVSSTMTFKILMDDTLNIIHRSDIRSAADPALKNKQVDPLTMDWDADIPELIKSAIAQGIRDSFSPVPNHGEDVAEDSSDELSSGNTHGEQDYVEMVNDDDGKHKPLMHVVDPQDLVERTFLLDEQEDGQRHQAKIIEYVAEHNAKNKSSDDHVKFQWTINDDQYKESITYNELMDYIQKNAKNDEIMWQFKQISGH